MMPAKISLNEELQTAYHESEYRNVKEVKR